MSEISSEDHESESLREEIQMTENVLKAKLDELSVLMFSTDNPLWKVTMKGILGNFRAICELRTPLKYDTKIMSDDPRLTKGPVVFLPHPINPDINGSLFRIGEQFGQATALCNETRALLRTLYALYEREEKLDSN